MTKKEKERLRNASENFFMKLIHNEFEEVDFLSRKVMCIKITKEDYEELEPFFHARRKTEYVIGEMSCNTDEPTIVGNILFITKTDGTEEVYVEVSNNIARRTQMLGNLYELIDMCSSGPREIPYKYIHPDAKG